MIMKKWKLNNILNICLGIVCFLNLGACNSKSDDEPAIRPDGYFSPVLFETKGIELSPPGNVIKKTGYFSSDGGDFSLVISDINWNQKFGFVSDCSVSRLVGENRILIDEAIFNVEVDDNRSDWPDLDKEWFSFYYDFSNNPYSINFHIPANEGKDPLVYLINLGSVPVMSEIWIIQHPKE